MFLSCPAHWEKPLLLVCGDLPSLSPDWSGTEVKIANLLPGGTSGKEALCQCSRHKRRVVQSLGWENPLEKGLATHSSHLAWGIHGQRSLAGYSPWGHKELQLLLLSRFSSIRLCVTP